MFICLKKELDTVIEIHQKLFNIQKLPLVQGALVLQIVSGLRDYLQESSAMPWFLYPLLAILFWLLSQAGCRVGCTFILTQYVCYYALMICSKLSLFLLIFTNSKTLSLQRAVVCYHKAKL